MSVEFHFFTLQITILVRKGITEYVDVVFFVMESNVVIAAQRTVDTLNQMTLKALTQRFADTVNTLIDHFLAFSIKEIGTYMSQKCLAFV